MPNLTMNLDPQLKKRIAALSPKVRREARRLAKAKLDKKYPPRIPRQ